MKQDQNHRFKGYFNYYVRGILKTHYFERATKKQVLDMRSSHVIHADRYCGSKVVRDKNAVNI